MNFVHGTIARFLFIILVISFKQYDTVSADQGEIMVFSPMIGDAQHINLESKHNYRVLLQLHKDESSNKSHERNKEYYVKAPDYAYFGIMAVVQNLYLRKNLNAKSNNETELDNTNKCRDYIQFFNAKHNQSSSKICGLVSKGNAQYEIAELIGPRVYYNEYGSLVIKFHIDDNVYEYDKDDPIIVEVEIAITAYTACPSTNVGIQKLARCSDIETISCIPQSLFCDGKIDCGFQHSFGVDEDNCFAYKYYKHGIVIFVFGVFVLLLIYCIVYWVRKHYSRSLYSM